MRINLPAISFIVAFALLAVGAVATSGTLWQESHAISADTLCDTCTDEKMASLLPALSKAQF